MVLVACTADSKMVNPFLLSTCAVRKVSSLFSISAGELGGVLERGWISLDSTAGRGMPQSGNFCILLLLTAHHGKQLVTGFFAYLGACNVDLGFLCS